jgi:hypothetical protein
VSAEAAEQWYEELLSAINSLEKFPNRKTGEKIASTIDGQPEIASGLLRTSNKNPLAFRQRSMSRIILSYLQKILVSFGDH